MNAKGRKAGRAQGGRARCGDSPPDANANPAGSEVAVHRIPGWAALPPELLDVAIAYTMAGRRNDCGPRDLAAIRLTCKPWFASCACAWRRMMATEWAASAYARLLMALLDAHRHVKPQSHVELWLTRPRPHSGDGDGNVRTTFFRVRPVYSLSCTDVYIQPHHLGRLHPECGGAAIWEKGDGGEHDRPRLMCGCDSVARLERFLTAAPFSRPLLRRFAAKRLASWLMPADDVRSVTPATGRSSSAHERAREWKAEGAFRAQCVPCSAVRTAGDSTKNAVRIARQLPRVAEALLFPPASSPANSGACGRHPDRRDRLCCVCALGLAAWLVERSESAPRRGKGRNADKRSHEGGDTSDGLLLAAGADWAERAAAWSDLPQDCLALERRLRIASGVVPFTGYLD